MRGSILCHIVAAIITYIPRAANEILNFQAMVDARIAIIFDLIMDFPLELVFNTVKLNACKHPLPPVSNAVFSIHNYSSV